MPHFTMVYCERSPGWPRHPTLFKAHCRPRARFAMHSQPRARRCVRSVAASVRPRHCSETRRYLAPCTESPIAANRWVSGSWSSRRGSLRSRRHRGDWIYRSIRKGARARARVVPCSSFICPRGPSSVRRLRTAILPRPGSAKTDSAVVFPSQRACRTTSSIDHGSSSCSRQEPRRHSLPLAAESEEHEARKQGSLL
jgi:hypothetical protein